MNKEEAERMKQELLEFCKQPNTCKIMKERTDIAIQSKTEVQHNAKNQPQRESHVAQDDASGIAHYRQEEAEEAEVSELYKINDGKLNSRESLSDARNSSNRYKSPDSDDMFDKTHDNGKLKQCRNQSTKASNSHAMSVNMQFEHEQLNRWKVDPLSATVGEHDRSLREPERRPSQERYPFQLCKDARTSDTHEIMKHLSTHLKNMADLWHKWHRNEDSNVQWGSPIQVGIVNGSSDKNELSLKPEPDDQESETDTTIKESHSITCKRKAPPGIGMMQKASSGSDKDDESSCVAVKRKKKRKLHLTNNAKVQHSNDDIGVNEGIVSTRSKSNENENEIEIEIVKDDNETHVGNPNVMSLRKKRSKTPERRSESPEPSISYPKRITPPNPRKYQKQKNRSIDIPSINSDFLDNLSDNNKLQGREVNEDNSVKPKEMKPLSIKKISNRLQQQCMRLKEISIERSNSTSKSSEFKKEDEDKRKRQKAYERELQERNEIRRKEEEIERKENEMSQRYNEILNCKQRESKGRSSRLRKEEEEEEEENNLLQDNDDLRIIEENTELDTGNSVNCPICNEPFPPDKIENHAAECERYNYDDQQDEQFSKQDETAGTKKSVRYNRIVHECNVCSSFKTDNGIKYEDHVNECLERHRREQDRQSDASTSIKIDDIPTSPIRSYRSISEQSDSHINYNAQFATNSNKQSYSIRKRKR